MIAFDFETALIEPGLSAPPPVCLALAGAAGDAALVTETMHAEMQTLLAQPLLVGANTAYDMRVAAQAWPDLLPEIFRAYDEDRVTDVQIRQKLIDIALGEYRQHGGYILADLTKRLCDRTLEKEDTWRLRYWGLHDVPLDLWPPDAVQYPKDDATATRDVFNAQEQGLFEVQREAVLQDQFRQARADFALKLASAWGLRTDPVRVAALRKQCEDRQQALCAELTEAGLLKETKKGISRCVRVAQARMKAVCPRPRLTAKGQELHCDDVKYISVDEEACQDSGDLLLEHYSEYARLGTLLSGHVTAMEQGTVLPIHTRFEVLLDTGRTSSSNPNVQNVRRLPGARECFCPRPGYVYAGCDYGGAELHTLAQTCIDLFGQSAMADALNAGQDLHALVGAGLAHTTYEELTAAITAGDDTAKEWRQRAKPANFGFPGGMGAEGMQAYAKSTYGVVMTLDECETLYEGWQTAWPEVADRYLGWIRELTSATGFATIEHFTSHRWRGHVPYCAAANSFFQGRAADGAKAALYAVARAEYLPGSALYGSRTVNFVHDELIVEVPLDRAPEAADELARIMVREFNVYTPDVPVSAEPVLMDCWSKKAKELRGEDGRLQLWRYEG